MADVTTVACPKCAVKLKLKGDVAGKKVACPKCGTTFRIKPRPDGASDTGSGDGSRAGSKKRSSQKSPSGSNAPARKKRTSTTASKTAARRNPAAERSAAAGAGPSRKKRKKTRPEPVEEFDDFYDDFAPEDDDGAGDFYDDGYDDFGDGMGDGYDDPYSATPRRKKKKTKSGGSKKKKSKGSSEGLQPKLHAMGFAGWLLAGCAAGLVGIILTTIGGFLDIAIVISGMALVTGGLVGTAIRFVANPTQGWAPGITSAVVAVAAIMIGKVAAFYVWTGELIDDVGDTQTLQQAIDDASSDSALISEFADKVQEDWLASRKITPEQIADWDEQQWQDYEEGDYEDYEAGEPYDYSQDYMPVVWEEATRQWNELSEEEKQQKRDAAAQIIRDDWVGDNPDARDMTNEEVQEELDNVVRSAKIIVAIFAACVNIFFPLYSLFFFCGGVFGAFKLASNLGDDT